MKYIDDKQKRDHLDRILASQVFATSQAYKELLRYLVEASINDNPPKEFSIATEVFHKGADFDPGRDTIVRVYVYNLRKKLDHYYKEEGRDEKIRIDIPKGHYEINFVPRKHFKNSPGLQKWLLPGLAILLVLSNAYFIWRTLEYKKFHTPIKSAVWQDFFQSDFDKQIVLGDHFFFVKDSRDRDKRTIMRQDNINSVEDFNAYKSQDVNRRDYVQLRYPMFPKNSVWPLADISALLSQCDIDFELEYASNINAVDFREKDMIFIGSLHTLGAFAQTFRSSNFSYKVYPNELSYVDPATDSLMVLGESGDPVYNHIDYGLARKIPGPNHTTIFMFTSFHETGTHGIVKYFTQQTTLAELDELLIDKFGHVPPYFEILFRASGYNRTVYTTSVEQVFEIPAESVFW